MTEVHLNINGRAVTAHAGQTILEAARAAGVDIPTLCHHPAVSNHGACRMCLVEVKGMRGLQTACTCPVSEGMEVQTETEAIVAGRKFALELLFSERNHYCMYCQVSGDCELQALAYRHGLDHWSYPRLYPKLAVDASHPYIIHEPNRCILCTRCVRACAEIAANHTLGLRERGSDMMLMADLAVPLGESSCVSCGTCLQVCPTGALIDARSAYGGHEEELTLVRSTCTQCSVGCAIEVAVRGNRLLRINGVWDAPPSDGLLCVHGRFEPLYERRARIAAPHVRKDGQLVETTWDEALACVTQRLKDGAAQGLATCAVSDEALAAFARLFPRAHRLEPAAPPLGDGASARVRDILEADFIVVAGADPLTYQPVVGYFIKRAADRGAQVALIGDAENGLADRAALAVGQAEAAAVVAQAAQAARPLVVYSVGLKPEAAAALQPLAGKARFLALDPARNGQGAAAAGLTPLDAAALASAPPAALYLLLGEQDAPPEVIAACEGAFLIVHAAYHSPLTARADVLLPAPIWAERGGHFTNVERVTTALRPALPMPPAVRDEAEVLGRVEEGVRG